MSILLDGIDLGDLVIVDEMNRLFINTKTASTLGGKGLFWSQNTNYTELVLMGGADYGWLTRDILLQLKTMAGVPNSSYILDYEGIQMEVRFKTEDNPISATPLISRPNQEGIDYYNNITLKFMEVI